MRQTREQHEARNRQTRGTPARRQKTPATGRELRTYEINGRWYAALTKSEARALAKTDAGTPLSAA